MSASRPPMLPPAEVERRVIAYLRGKSEASRQEWKALGPLGMRYLYSKAVAHSEDAEGHRLRGAALVTLGKLAGGSSVGPLLGVLAEADLVTVVRCGAIEGLGFARHPRALPALQTQAFHADFKVRLYAASALGRIGTPGALRALRDLASRDPHSQVRRAAQVEVDRAESVA